MLPVDSPANAPHSGLYFGFLKRFVRGTKLPFFPRRAPQRSRPAGQYWQKSYLSVPALLRYHPSVLFDAARLNSRRAFFRVIGIQKCGSESRPWLFAVVCPLNRTRVTEMRCSCLTDCLSSALDGLRPCWTTQSGSDRGYRGTG